MGKSEFSCDCDIIHSDVVEKVQKTLPNNEIIEHLADFYKIFGDTTRIRILYALLKNELCVCDISVLLDMTISAVSHQLKILREANLVATNRVGKVVFYSVADTHIKEMIECGHEHVLVHILGNKNHSHC